MNQNSTAEQLKIGDWVRFRAGSPQMQILEFEGDGAKCLWFLGVQQQVAWVSFAVLDGVDTRHRYSLVPTLETSM